MGKEPRKPVLGDHVPMKRRLIPPFVSAFGGKLAQYSWTRQLVPEALWLGLVIDRLGWSQSIAAPPGRYLLGNASTA